MTGIDISREMLARARARVARRHLESVEALLEMDAQAMDFPDDAFDAVLAMYAVAVVPDAAALIREITRVCKPGGTIVIVNHFKTDNRAVAACDRLLRPLHRRVSHRTDIELNRFVKQTGLQVVSRAGTNLFRYSTLLACRNRA